MYRIASRVAILAANAELKHARALGAGWFDAYASSLRVLDEVTEVIALADPTPVLTRFKAHPR